MGRQDKALVAPIKRIRAVAVGLRVVTGGRRLSTALTRRDERFVVKSILRLVDARACRLIR